MNLPENVVCTQNADAVLSDIIKGVPSKVFVLVDENTAKYCLPLLPCISESGASIIEIHSGEQYKNIDTARGSAALRMRERGFANGDT